MNHSGQWLGRELARPAVCRGAGGVMPLRILRATRLGPHNSGVPREPEKHDCNVDEVSAMAAAEVAPQTVGESQMIAC
jgi:hypothetical protein